MVTGTRAARVKRLRFNEALPPIADTEAQNWRTAWDKD